MCSISMDSSRHALQTNGKLLPNFNFVFKLLAENRKIFKPHEYWSKCNVLYIVGEAFVLISARSSFTGCCSSFERNFYFLCRSLGRTMCRSFWLVLCLVCWGRCSISLLTLPRAEYRGPSLTPANPSTGAPCGQ